MVSQSVPALASDRSASRAPSRSFPDPREAKPRQDVELVEITTARVREIEEFARRADVVRRHEVLDASAGVEDIIPEDLTLGISFPDEVVVVLAKLRFELVAEHVVSHLDRVHQTRRELRIVGIVDRDSVRDAIFPDRVP